MMFTLGLLESA